MTSYIKIILLFFIMLILSSCTRSTQPRLTDITTSLSYKIDKNSDDIFSSNDDKLYLTTKWENSKLNTIYEYKIYMPDGRLYQYERYKQKDNIKIFSLSYPIYIKNLFVQKLEGVWNANIYINNKLTTQKKFYIGDKNKQYKKAKPNIKIMIKPYIDDKKSSWKLGRLLSKHLAWSILYHHKNIEIIPYNQSSVKDIDYLIYGNILSKWDKNTQETKIQTSLENISKKAIINTTQITHSTQWFNFNRIVKQKKRTLDPQRLIIYKKVYLGIKDTISTLSIK